MSDALESSSDMSNMSLTQRISEFLRFASDLAEKDRQRVAAEGEESSPVSQLEEYLNAISDYVSPHVAIDDDDTEDERKSGLRTNLRVVRLVYGDTKIDVRQRVMLAFNSPLFPEILVRSVAL